MKKFTCYMIDDEPLAIDVLLSYAAKSDRLEVLGFSTDPAIARKEVQEHKPDLLFVDIEMPGLDGLELIRTLEHQPAIIITTAYREFAVEGFELNVLDYLVKPIAFKRFLQALEKFKDQYLSTERESNFILVRANRKQVKINHSEIVIIEGLKDYARIRLHGDEILTKATLTELEHQLPPEAFIRVHKSFIVSKANITAFSTTDIELGKYAVPIGRNYKEIFLKFMKPG